jgi:hypothetical protein
MGRAIVLVAMVALTSRVQAGQPATIGQNVVLSLEVLTRGLVYSRGTFDPDVRGNGEYPVFFASEAPRLIVRLQNRTPSVLTIGQPDQPWSEALQLRIRTGQGRREAVIAVPVRLAGAPPPAFSIDPKREAATVIEVLRDDRKKFSPGIYALEVFLLRSSLPATLRPLNDSLVARTSFEVRDVNTEDARLDLYLHRAFRARDEGNLALARKWAQSVVARHQNSGAGAWELAHLWLREGNCKQAIPWLLRAEMIMETKADTRIKRRNWDYEIRGAPVSLLTKCGSRLAPS